MDIDKLNWDYPTAYTYSLTVKTQDIDGLGHVNNANYVQWCERCAWNHSETLGLTVKDYQKLDKGVVIVKANYQYFLPNFENDSLVVGTWLVSCDRKLRVERCFQIINQQSGETVLRAHWSLVCVSLSTGKASRLPEEFIEIYGGAVVDAVNKETSF